MATDLFVHLPPLTPIEGRVLYGVLAAWCNGRDESDPLFDVVLSLLNAVGDARDAHDLLKRASSDA